jgi:K(+)-stimulated pyrophosphate-energized sodium pump
VNWFVVSVVVALLSFATAGWLYAWVNRQASETKKTQEVGALIRDGANVFLAREYRLLSYFVIVVALVIGIILPQPIWQGDPGRNIIQIGAWTSHNCAQFDEFRNE